MLSKPRHRRRSEGKAPSPQWCLSTLSPRQIGIVLIGMHVLVLAPQNTRFQCNKCLRFWDSNSDDSLYDAQSKSIQHGRCFSSLRRWCTGFLQRFCHTPKIVLTFLSADSDSGMKNDIFAPERHTHRVSYVRLYFLLKSYAWRFICWSTSTTHRGMFMHSL